MMSWLKHRGRTLATSPVRGMSVLVLMALDTLLVACSSVASGSTVTRPAVSASPPAVVDPSSLPTITVIAHDFSFAMPTSLSAGLTVVKFVNAGTQAHQAAFARLKHGITTNRVLALAKEGGAAEAQIESLIDFAGGPNVVPPRGQHAVILNFTPGQYVAICFMRAPDGMVHYDMGMIQPFVVKTAVGAAPQGEPKADAVVGLVNFSFVVPPTLQQGDPSRSSTREARPTK